jgi:hypothetical protein
MQSLPENADQFWARPPSRDKGDATPDLIHQSMGHALTLWEGIEYHFVGLFCHFIEPRDARAASRAYGSVSSSQGRMEALDNAAEVYFQLHQVSEDLEKEFKLIRRHFDKARGLRNDIAHAITMDFMFGGGDDTAGNFLLPAMYGTRKTTAFVPDDGDRFSILRSKYRFTAEDIRLIITKFRLLEGVALRFHGKFAEAHPPFEAK